MTYMHGRSHSLCRCAFIRELSPNPDHLAMLFAFYIDMICLTIKGGLQGARVTTHVTKHIMHIAYAAYRVQWALINLAI